MARKTRFSPGLVVLLICALVLAACVLGGVLYIISGCSAQLEPADKAGAHAPKHIFLFVGDGMGINQVAATRYFQQARDGSPLTSPWRDSFDGFPYVGLMSTHSLSPVTDSAAGITAMLSGRKAENGTINYDAATGESMLPFAHMAKLEGYSVGVVTTTGVDHATPAGVYASVKSRSDFRDIARQGIAPDYLDFLGGGGFCAEDSEACIALAENNGFTLAKGAHAIRELDLPAKGPVLALAGGGIKRYNMAYELDRQRSAQYGGEELAFHELVGAAIRQLSGKEKFFLLSEAAMVDMACANQDLLGALYEVEGLDSAVAEALAFYEAHPDDTLIVVLADHETGGLRIRTKADFQKLGAQLASYDRFVSIMDELYNAGADFDAALEKADHYFTLHAAQLGEDTLASLNKAYEKSLARPDGLDPFALALCEYVADQANVGFETPSHTGMPVAVYAMGAGAEQFAGVYDNTEIFTKLSALMGAK